MSVPRFVVVGHVNRGKSSVVSTLAADESVRIEPNVGTTVECRTFPMRVNDRVLYELIDTPGFERPRQMLQWLREHETTTAERRAVVERFVREHATDARFEKECRLLAPVLEGAAVLYVVDGSVPFTEQYEYEMQIIQWTGQPRMALINMIHEENYIDAWRPVLDQYFNLVHTFDAHEASFADRIRLIRALREIHKPWEGALNDAIAGLLTERRQLAHDAAAEMAATLVAMVTLVKSKRLSAEADVEPHKQPLATRYFDELRRLEERGWASVAAIYRREAFEVKQGALSATGDDLFSQDVWLRFGLSRGKLAAGGAATGAAAGGMFDAAVGGASFLLGAVIGGIVGAGAGWLGAMGLPRTQVLHQRMGGKLLQIGPMRNVQFPWIVLGRAMEHQRVVSGAPHARRGSVDIDGNASIADQISDEEHKAISRLFDRLRRLPDAATMEEIRFELAHRIEALLLQREQLDAL